MQIIFFLIIGGEIFASPPEQIANAVFPEPRVDHQSLLQRNNPSKFCF